MITEIKKLKIKKIEEELQKTNSIVEERKRIEEAILELDKKINEQLIPFQRFNFLQRHILKRKEYKNYKEQTNKIDLMERTKNKLRNQKIELEIKEGKSNRERLQAEIEEVQNAETLQELGLDFTKAKQILEEKVLPITLEEQDKYIQEQEVEYSKMEDFILVHKTDFEPRNSKIESPKEANALFEKSITLNGETYPYFYERERDTVHFSVNGEVAGHEYGNWDNSKYAVLIPFADVSKEKIGMASSVDTFSKGGVDITPNSWILCPKGEVERIQRNNPEVHVLGYEGEKVADYANTVLSALGYNRERSGKWCWANKKADDQFNKIMEEQGLKIGHHTYTEYYQQDRLKETINKLTAIFSVIKRSRLIKDKEDIENIRNQLNSTSNIVSPTFNQLLQEATIDEEGLEMFCDKLSKEQIKIPSVVKTILRKMPREELYGKGRINLDDIIPSDIEELEQYKDIIENLRKDVENYNNCDKQVWNTNERKILDDITMDFFASAVLQGTARSKEKDEKKKLHKNIQNSKRR